MKHRLLLPVTMMMWPQLASCISDNSLPWVRKVEESSAPYDESSPSSPMLKGRDPTNTKLPFLDVEDRIRKDPFQQDEDKVLDKSYARIMALKDVTLPHKCFVSIIDANTFDDEEEEEEDNSAPSSSSYPVVWCDVIIPNGLNVTAEILPLPCNEFIQEAQSDVIQCKKQCKASPLLFPEFSDEEKILGEFDRSYCVGVDILYNNEPIIQRRYAMDVTYDYEKMINDSSGILSLSSATLHDDENSNNTQVDKRNVGTLSIALAMLFGAVATLALVAIVVGDTKRKRKVHGRKRHIDASEIVKEADMTNCVDKMAQLKHTDVGIC